MVYNFRNRLIFILCGTAKIPYGKENLRLVGHDEGEMKLICGHIDEIFCAFRFQFSCDVMWQRKSKEII